MVLVAIMLSNVVTCLSVDLANKFGGGGGVEVKEAEEILALALLDLHRVVIQIMLTVTVQKMAKG